jgi:hypothetical protein
VRRLSFFLNAYLVAFLVDGVLSFLDEMLGASGVEVLSPLRHFVAVPVLLASACLYALVGLVARLPKRVVLPPVVFSVWVYVGAFPIAFYAPLRDAAVALAAAQVAVGLLALLLVHRFAARESWLFTPQSLAGAELNVRRGLGFVALNALLLPVLGGGYAVVWGLLAIRELTHGFTWINADGVYAEERQYVRGDKRVYLIAMIHFGDRAYYEDVVRSLPTGNAVVLAEGVTDDSGLLAGPPAVSDGVVPRAGLVAQGEVAIGAEHRVEAADLDVAELSDATVGFVNAIHEVVGSHDSRDALDAYTRYVDSFGRDVISGAIMELIEVRNAHLLTRISESLERYDRIVVPWGAAHMPGLETAIRADGFTLLSRKARRVVGFWD